jgi:hypothetical protein
MIATINPVVYGQRRWKWLFGVALFALGAALGGWTLAALLGAMGQFLLGGNSSTAGWLVVALFAAVFGLNELGFLPIPRLQRRWQVPASWRSTLPPWLAAFLYGLILGVGVMTYIESAAFYVASAWGFVLAEPLAAGWMGASFGLSQAILLVLVTWSSQTADEVHQQSAAVYRNRSLMRIAVGMFLLATASGLWVQQP